MVNKSAKNTMEQGGWGLVDIRYVDKFDNFDVWRSCVVTKSCSNCAIEVLQS